jgi:uncharacterized protein
MTTPLRRLLAALLVAALVTACGTSGEVDWPEDQRDTFVISTGNSTGVYAAYGERLGEVIEERTGVSVEVVPSGGSIDNLQHLAAGKADLAFSAVDAAADATAGRGAFEEPVEVRTLARVYDDFAHLVVAADSEITAIDDLRGRPVAIGARDSGTALIARRLLRAADIELTDLDTRALSLEDSVEGLREGRLEAFFWSGGLRTPSLEEFAEEYPIRLVPLGHLVNQVRSDFGSGYRHGAVPAGTYGATGEVATLAVPNVLVMRADASDALAYAQLDVLFRSQDRIAASVPAAAVLDRAKAIFTEPLELHPGAVRYYRDTGS